MTSYSDYSLSNRQKELIKDALVGDKIQTYVGLHGEQPSTSMIQDWYAGITETELGKYKCRKYADAVSDELNKK